MDLRCVDPFSRGKSFNVERNRDNQIFDKHRFCLENSTNPDVYAFFFRWQIEDKLYLERQQSNFTTFSTVLFRFIHKTSNAYINLTFGCSKAKKLIWCGNSKKQQTVHIFENHSNMHTHREISNYGVYSVFEWKSLVSLFHSRRKFICLFPFAVE